MKKLIQFLMVLVLVLSFSGCKKDLTITKDEYYSSGENNAETKVVKKGEEWETAPCTIYNSSFRSYDKSLNGFWNMAGLSQYFQSSVQTAGNGVKYKYFNYRWLSQSYPSFYIYLPYGVSLSDGKYIFNLKDWNGNLEENEAYFYYRTSSSNSGRYTAKTGKLYVNIYQGQVNVHACNISVDPYYSSGTGNTLDFHFPFTTTDLGY